MSENLKYAATVLFEARAKIDHLFAESRPEDFPVGVARKINDAYCALEDASTEIHHHLKEHKT